MLEVVALQLAGRDRLAPHSTVQPSVYSTVPGVPGEAALEVGVAVARTGAPELGLQQAEFLTLQPALHSAHHLQHSTLHLLPQVNIAETANLLLLAL